MPVVIRLSITLTLKSIATVQRASSVLIGAGASLIIYFFPSGKSIGVF